MTNPVSEKENYELKPVKLRLKFELGSEPTGAEGLVNTYIHTVVCGIVEGLVRFVRQFDKSTLFYIGYL